MKPRILQIARIVAALLLSAFVSCATDAWADTVTYEMSNSVDDTRGSKGSGGQNVNWVTQVNGWFGRYTWAGYNFDNWTYVRWPVTIPRGSKVSSANISFKADVSNSSAFNTTINYLAIEGSPAWRGANGFSTSNYSNADALLAIGRSSASVAWNNVAAWTAESWHDSPNIGVLVQENINDLADYDPLDATAKYIGFAIDDGDGSYAEADNRNWYAYDNGAADAAELDVTFEPWAQVRTANGMKYDANYGCYRYFDY